MALSRALTPLHRWVALLAMKGVGKEAMVGTTGWGRQYIVRCLAELGASTRDGRILLQKALDQFPPGLQRSLEYPSCQEGDIAALQAAGLEYAAHFKDRPAPLSPYAQFASKERENLLKLRQAVMSARVWGLARSQTAELFGGTSHGLEKYLKNCRMPFPPGRLRLDAALQFVEEEMDTQQRRWLASIPLETMPPSEASHRVGEQDIMEFWVSPRGRSLAVQEMAERLDVVNVLHPHLRAMASRAQIPPHRLLIPVVYYLRFGSP